MVRQILNTEEKTCIARFVLEALPDWFGIPEAREEYIQNSREQLFLADVRSAGPVGFLCLKPTGKATVELAVMGVLQSCHRQGIGRALVEAAKQAAIQQGYHFLQVKTVQTGRYKEYDATNRFYLAMGFEEFEVFPELWGAANPCQIYVMALR